MKRLILLIVTISLFGFMGCEKEPLPQMNNDKGTAEVVMRTLKSGGEDGDPVVQGNIVDANGGSVSAATVELFVEGNGTPVATDISDANGIFQFQAAQGDYYIVVTPGVQNSVNTGTFSLTGNTHMTIEI
ncbi:carboxypeptidase regulatory-like domain-containing protein [bacterium SCSIO 12741]|nr:carboxypeptidase regulatory-like domain-containing protein [bacterium SCSIO 12741]